ncbi:efflux RND transporter periplasmic adaptor subunit [Pseudomonas fluorescens]|uniref:efflux RND transporter periplasmic adaptor subunit n=1 Tax=Pseudomonas fluorescens TaxID=294 RepID=UPI00124263C9|nr:efflux RND transporter periplasmic adaptor subunit [Pseudomonas fluorescens]VVN36994.1 Solvent efflux pump periplasmic linker SrpA [Pseudomonas fluorescens]
MFKSSRLIVGLLPLSALILAACKPTEQVADQAAAVKVGYYTVIEAPLALTTDLPGRTSAYRVAEVRPQVAGILERRLFTEGSEVKQGQALYQIDPRTYIAQQARAEANLRSARNLAERYERLLKSRAVSQQQYDDAVATWKQAAADKQVADINVQYTKVLSPISGRIGRSAMTEGALVTNGQIGAMATVNQLDPIYVDVTQSITRILELKRALKSGDLKNTGSDQAEVSLTLDDGSAYPLSGTLKFSEVSVDQGTGSVTLRAVFPNPDRALLPGMFVHAQVKEGVRERALLVPQQAIRRDSRGVATAWVVTDDNHVEQRDLETVRTVGNAWLVDSGVRPGERVITEGLQHVQADSLVDAQPATRVELKAAFTAN